MNIIYELVYCMLSSYYTQMRIIHDFIIIHECMLYKSDLYTRVRIMRVRELGSYDYCQFLKEPHNGKLGVFADVSHLLRLFFIPNYRRPSPPPIAGVGLSRTQPLCI